jgi:Gene product 88
MLKRTKDRKVTNSVTAGGNVRIANAFSLPAGISCPGMTDYCDSVCYAGKLESIYPGFRNTVMHNWTTLQNRDMFGMHSLIVNMIRDFIEDCDKWNAPKFFRIHADGDFFSDDYTNAWMIAMLMFPEVTFWVYTRNVSAAVKIHKAKINNCSMYFSGDPENITVANMLNNIYGIQIAMLDDTFDMAKSAVKGVRCPENNGSLPLISVKGSACAVCGYCINGRGNVLFSKSKS